MSDFWPLVKTKRAALLHRDVLEASNAAYAACSFFKFKEHVHSLAHTFISALSRAYIYSRTRAGKEARTHLRIHSRMRAHSVTNASSYTLYTT